MITLGQVIAYGIGTGFENVHGGWRWMVGLGTVPAGFQVWILFFMPESRECRSHTGSFGDLCFHCPSPSARIMIRKGDMEGARRVTTKIYAFAKPEEIDLKARCSIYAISHFILPNYTALGQSAHCSCPAKHRNYQQYHIPSTLAVHAF